MVNGEPGVSPRLAKPVLVVSKRLKLRRPDRRSLTIGVVLEDVANPFASTLHRAIEDVAVERGVLVLAGSSDADDQRERELVEAFAARRVDGLIIQSSRNDHRYLLNERAAGVAMVFVDRPPEEIDADHVVTDNVAGIRHAVRHLVEHGHRQIGYLGDLHSIATAAERYRGYIEELVEQKIGLDPYIVRLDLRGIAKAEAAAAHVMRDLKPPTALVTGQNLITIGAFRALRAMDLHERIALVGFDDFLLADLVEPGITVIAQDPGESGRVAAAALFRRLDGDPSPAQRHTVHTRMIARGSGEIRP